VLLLVYEEFEEKKSSLIKDETSKGKHSLVVYVLPKIFSVPALSSYRQLKRRRERERKEDSLERKG
jgi:hypothetical protein